MADPATAAVSHAGGRSRWQLAFASGAVLLAAADTYVVVLALTSIMFDLGLGIDQLQRATPIISGFLVGYVAVLPLLGRLSDLYGRQPVFIACLLTFAFGSLITASGSTLTMVVVGRIMQGLGGGGLVPVTLALVADLWPAQRRGVPLGVVAAVQEFGSVLGPLYGAAILAVTTWRWIFWLNLPLAALLGCGLWMSRPRESRGASTRPEQRNAGRQGRHDVVGCLLLLLGVVALLLAITSPPPLTNSVGLGALYGPMVGDLGITTPMAVIGVAAMVVFGIWETLQLGGIRPLLRLRATPAVLRRADWPGALLLSGVLAAVVISFAAADPSRQIVSSMAFVLLPAALIAAVVFVFHERRTAAPLIHFPALRERAAIGALLVNFFVGTGLMAALIDIPIFARNTVYPDSQVGAALVLVRLLAAVPIGALLGGLICDRVGYRITTGIGMALAATGFVAMAHWDALALSDPLFGNAWVHASDLVLVGSGLGFGLAIAPVNAAVLAAVEASWHGLASALVVVARSVGMLIGLSLLTGLGLRRFYQVASTLPSPQGLCPSSPANCPAYDRLAEGAVVDELHFIFYGAAVACLIAALLGIALLRRGRADQHSLGPLAGG